MSLLKRIFGKKDKKQFSNNFVKHVTNGDWVGRDKKRLDKGGHSQKCIDYLDKNKIPYNIVKTYDNGVRVGNIPTHKEPKKQVGTNQSWFPKKWKDKTIIEAAKKVSRDTKNSGKLFNFGYYKTVKVGIVRNNGKITTAFPDSKQTNKKGVERKWK